MTTMTYQKARNEMLVGIILKKSPEENLEKSDDLPPKISSHHEKVSSEADLHEPAVSFGSSLFRQGKEQFFGWPEPDLNETSKHLNNNEILDQLNKKTRLFPPTTEINGVADRSNLERDFQRKCQQQYNLAVADRAREVVMELEVKCGFEPIDWESRGKRCGYDIESRPLVGTENPRFIEVKGRLASAATTPVTMTTNEILCSLKNPDSFILALVQFNGDLQNGNYCVYYLRKPCKCEPDVGVDSVNYNFANLLGQGIKVYERKI